MNEKLNFPETVILINAVHLNKITGDFKINFEKKLQRPLHDLDMAHFITCLALDASIPVSNKGAQVILIYDQSTSRLNFCQPSSLPDELNGTAFRDNNLGEFFFTSISPEDMASSEELYLDLLQILTESSEVKKILLAPSDKIDKTTLSILLKEAKGKEITLFSMKKPDHTNDYEWQFIAYPVMQALGIKGNEL